jgi:hypothetical protein
MPDPQDDLRQLTGIGDSTTFPGHTLSPRTLRDLAEAEERCRRDYIMGVERAAIVHGPAALEQYRSAAAACLRAGFRNGEPFFDSWILCRTTLPFLCWVLMRKTEPNGFNEAMAADIIGDPTYAQMKAVWRQWKYIEKKDDIQPEPSQGSPPTGTQSTNT